MSFETMEGQRREAADAILTKFGASIEQAEQRTASRTSDPTLKKLMAARMALEYAVLATAREKKTATEVVATALHGTNVAQQAAMLKHGTEALAQAYRVEPEVLVNVFAGRLSNVDMPTGLGSTSEIDQMVDACRNLVTSIVKDEYANRGLFENGIGKSESFIAPKSEVIVAPARSELAARLAFMESSIDAAVEHGSIGKANGEMLKERIEAQVFQPRPPQLLQFSKQFTFFFEERGKGIRIEAMKEVRGVTQSLTVQEINAQLRRLMPASSRPGRPTDHRTFNPLER